MSWTFTASDGMANSLDIVLCQPELAYGGTERQILEIAKRFHPIIYTCRLQKSETLDVWKDFDVRLIRPSVLEAPAVLVGKLDPDERMARLASAGARFLTMKIRDDYDVINAHLMPSEWIRNRNERVMWYCHCPCRPAYQWKQLYLSDRGLMGKVALTAAIGVFDMVEQRVVRKIERICTNSEFTAGNIGKYLGRQDAKVVYPGVDTKEFYFEDYKRFFFYPSRFVPEKRFEIAINAFKKANLPGWKLVLGGMAVNTPQSRAYIARLRRLAGPGEVEFLFDMDEKRLKRLYATCRAVLFSSMLEDWGLVPVEGMACSKPVIAMDEGGPRESIVHGKTGFLVNSADEMAEKMRYFAERPGECEKMGKAGRKRVEQNYTWKIFLGKMEKVFKETSKM
jgi:glycosyltransferase involved in cell wall biosynthesis